MDNFYTKFVSENKKEEGMVFGKRGFWKMFLRLGEMGMLIVTDATNVISGGVYEGSG